MNIDRINYLREFYAARQNRMNWSSYKTLDGVCAGQLLADMAIPKVDLYALGDAAGWIAERLDIPYESAYALFWLKEPGGLEYLTTFNSWHITKQRNFLEAALRGLIEKGELHFDPVEWPA